MKVRIYRPHNHAGIQHQPGPDGIEIDVSAQDAEFLKAIGTLDKPQSAEPKPASIKASFAPPD